MFVVCVFFLSLLLCTIIITNSLLFAHSSNLNFAIAGMTLVLFLFCSCCNISVYLFFFLNKNHLLVAGKPSILMVRVLMNDKNTKLVRFTRGKEAKGWWRNGRGL